MSLVMDLLFAPVYLPNGDDVRCLAQRRMGCNHSRLGERKRGTHLTAYSSISARASRALITVYRLILSCAARPLLPQTYAPS